MCVTSKLPPNLCPAQFKLCFCYKIAISSILCLSQIKRIQNRSHTGIISLWKLCYIPLLFWSFFNVFNFLFFRQARSCDRMQSHKSGTESSSQSSLCQMQTFLHFPNPLTWSKKPQIIQVN